MRVKTREDLVAMIAKRDGVGMGTVERWIDQCKEEIGDEGTTYDEAVELLKDYLGIEPDYLDIVLWG